DNWLRHVGEVREKHQRTLAPLDRDAALDRLCELNVVEQARHVCETTVVQDAWARRQMLAVHGWVYGLGDGKLHDTTFVACGSDEVGPAYDHAVSRPLAGVR